MKRWSIWILSSCFCSNRNRSRVMTWETESEESKNLDHITNPVCIHNPSFDRIRFGRSVWYCDVVVRVCRPTVDATASGNVDEGADEDHVEGYGQPLLLLGQELCRRCRHLFLQRMFHRGRTFTFLTLCFIILRLFLFMLSWQGVDWYELQDHKATKSTNSHCFHPLFFYSLWK